MNPTAVLAVARRVAAATDTPERLGDLLAHNGVDICRLLVRLADRPQTTVESITELEAAVREDDALPPPEPSAAASARPAPASKARTGTVRATPAAGGPSRDFGTVKAAFAALGLPMQKRRTVRAQLKADRRLAFGGYLFELPE